MYPRPKPGETEEDLLRLQDEFEKNKAANKVKPAAAFHYMLPTFVDEPSQEKSENTITQEADIVDQLANTFEAIPNDMDLKVVAERKPEQRTVPCFQFVKGKGFPQAKRRDPSVSSGKGSIFSRQIKRMKNEELPMETDTVPLTENALRIQERTSVEAAADEVAVSKLPDASLPSQSYVLTGSDSKQIHEENLQVMKSMTEQEILEERQKLIATMDPAIVAFLKSRRKKEVLQNRNPTIKEQNTAFGNIQVEEIETPAELLKQPTAERWLNFDTVETSKLAWMKDVDIPEINKSKQFEARFDFEGWLLPYSEPEINEQNRVLYHHGEEPGRPGYTLQELFQLSRSSVIQQKIISLNCIANVLSLNSTGVYDGIIDLPLEQIFFVVRFCLDDNTPAVLNASIKAMRNLIFSQVDESCLDGLKAFGMGLIEPVLAMDNEKEDDITENDQQLVEKNIVRCLARTEILTRIRYIINTVKPSLETIVYCMDILIRLARDSDLILSKIFGCDGLIETILANFVPAEINTGASTGSPYGLPLIQAIKLLRVISSRSRILAAKVISKYDILNSIAFYLSNDTFAQNVNGLRLQSECMHLWSLFIHYGLALEHFSALQPVLLNMLNYHFKNTNLDIVTTFARQGHASALLILLANAAKRNYNLITPFLTTLIEMCLPKWSFQFGILTEFVCGKLQMISALTYCLSCIRRYQLNNKTDEAILKLLQSKGFDTVTKNIKSGSMLLNNYDTHKSSSNLKTLEAAAWHTMDHVVPTMQTNSCIPFLHSLSLYISICDNREVKSSFLKHSNIQTYLTSLQKLDKYYLSSNWFARPESFVLMNMLKTAVSVKSDLDTSVFYELSVKCLCVFNAEQKPDIEYVLENIIFCPEFYPSEALLQNLSIEQRNSSLVTSLGNLGEVLEVYTQVLGLKNDIPDFSLTSCIDIAVGNVIPLDWIYTPILVLYSNQQGNKLGTEESQVFIIRNCLRWILIYETYFPLLAAVINPTDKFCRLACVFLGSDNLFLIKEIHDLLELCFKNVMKFENQLNFQKQIQGLSNFQDFYTQLLEQYQGVSYGDILFGNVVLVPLAQNHDIQYKKTLWSEYMGVVQIFNVSPEQKYNSNAMALGMFKLSHKQRKLLFIIFTVLNVVQILLGFGMTSTSFYIFVAVSPVLHTEKAQVNFAFVVTGIYGTHVMFHWIIGIKMCKKCFRQAHKKSTNNLLLLWYCVGTNTVVILIVISHFARKSGKQIVKSMRNSIATGMTHYLTDPSWKEIIDKLQYSNQCCGIDSYQNWHDTTWLTKYHVDVDSETIKDFRTSQESLHLPVTPWSCCNIEFPMQCLHDPVQQVQYAHLWVDDPDLIKDSINTKGCLDGLKRPITAVINFFVVLTSMVCILHIVIFIVSRILYTGSRNAILLNDPEGVAPGWIFGRGDCGYARGKTLAEMMGLSPRPSGLVDDAKNYESDKLLGDGAISDPEETVFNPQLHSTKILDEAELQNEHDQTEPFSMTAEMERMT
ncbi:hypothetical protein NQ315_010764 [Exocentrus adspersus]|uniref:RNA polymerase II-associated protein 1 n=1 Tax=Exocentrus adspersus TaxID=1586481 RepID=A0AAV8VTW2_9CUCU|nr:hypothetical protein NQ315_010764 [Exocentrus adspersus]